MIGRLGEQHLNFKKRPKQPKVFTSVRKIKLCQRKLSQRQRLGTKNPVLGKTLTFLTGVKLLLILQEISPHLKRYVKTM